MGTFVAMEAMRTLALTGDTSTISKIDALILAAPDIDIDVFRTQLATLTTRPKAMIVLVSEEDKALKLSGDIRGGHPRVRVSGWIRGCRWTETPGVLPA